MSIDKGVDSSVLDGYFSDIADAIRGKNGSQSTYTPSQMPTAISNIPTGGNLQDKTKSYTPTESAQSETFTCDNGYDGLDEVTVNVGAISSSYVGSGVARKSSSDLTASGATVTAPSGYYESNATKTISSGTVVPSSSISSSGGATITTETGKIVLSKTVNNVPQVTTAGYVISGTMGDTSVTLRADCSINDNSALSQSGDTVTALAGYYPSNATLTVSGGSSKNVQVLQSTTRTSNSSLTKVLGDLTVSKSGTYDIYWSGGRSNTSTSYTWGTRLYVDGTGYGTENTTWTNNCQSNHLSNVSLTANQKLSVYARGRTGSYYTFVPMLVIIEA